MLDEPIGYILHTDKSNDWFLVILSTILFKLFNVQFSNDVNALLCSRTSDRVCKNEDISTMIHVSVGFTTISSLAPLVESVHLLYQNTSIRR